MNIVCNVLKNDKIQQPFSYKRLTNGKISSVSFNFFEERQKVFITPLWITGFSGPSIVIIWISPHCDHKIQIRWTSDAFATLEETALKEIKLKITHLNNIQCPYIVLECFTGFSLRCNVIWPVNFGIIQKIQKQTGNARQWKWITSAFQQKYFVIMTIHGKTINHNWTGWATTNYSHKNKLFNTFNHEPHTYESRYLVGFRNILHPLHLGLCLKKSYRNA